jgi:hypothetical protein
MYENMPSIIAVPSEQQVNQHFSAMQDSVDLINSLKAKSSLSQEEQDTLARNKEHLVLMLSKDFIANDPRDKSTFVAAST